MAIPNYYAALGVQRTAAAEDIKKAYRKLAKQYHPDLHPGDKAAEERFKDISEAWETLGDEEKRKNYDAELARGGKKQQPTAGASSSAPKPKSTAMSQSDYEHLMRGFDQYLSPEKIKQQAKKAAANPIDTTSLFERYMGFTKKK